MTANIALDNRHRWDQEEGWWTKKSCHDRRRCVMRMNRNNKQILTQKRCIKKIMTFIWLVLLDDCLFALEVSINIWIEMLVIEDGWNGDDVPFWLSSKYIEQIIRLFFFILSMMISVLFVHCFGSIELWSVKVLLKVNSIWFVKFNTAKSWQNSNFVKVSNETFKE